MKNHLYSSVLLLALMGISISSFSQSAGFNTTGAPPNASALLDVDAAPNNNKGFLLPRVPLTATNNNAPIGPGIANSLMIYNTATVNDVYPGYYYWNGTKWMRFIDDAWQTLGNSGTNPATHFLGTVDNQDLVFRTNNTEGARILANGDVGIGTSAPTQKLVVNGNVQVGEVTTVPGDGNMLIFGGAGENTDPLTMKRVNVASDVSNIEMRLGDNGGSSNDVGIDRFVINSTEYPSPAVRTIMSVQSNGAVRIGSQKIPTTAPNYSIDNETWKLSVTGGYSFFGNYNNDPNVAGNPPGHTFVNGVGGLAVGVNRWGGTSGVDFWNVTTWNAVAANANYHRGFYFRRYDQAGNEQLLARLEGNGNFYATAYIVASDKRIKKDFLERKTAVLSKVNQIKVYDYTLRNQYNTSSGALGFNDASNTQDFGVIAQELYRVFPELVHKPKDEETELWGVDYAKLSLIIVQAIQEQQEVITEQASEIAHLKKELEDLKSIVNQLKK